MFLQLGFSIDDPHGCHRSRVFFYSSGAGGPTIGLGSAPASSSCRTRALVPTCIRHPLLTCSVREDAFDSLGIKQHPAPGTQVRHAARLRFGAQPQDRHPQPAGHLRQLQWAARHLVFHALIVGGSRSRCAGVMSAFAPELCHRLRSLESLGGRSVPLPLSELTLDQPHIL